MQTIEQKLKDYITDIEAALESGRNLDSWIVFNPLTAEALNFSFNEKSQVEKAFHSRVVNAQLFSEHDAVKLAAKIRVGKYGEKCIAMALKDALSLALNNEKETLVKIKLMQGGLKC